MQEGFLGLSLLLYFQAEKGGYKFMDDITDEIAGIYGARDKDVPGPFTFPEYIRLVGRKCLGILSFILLV